MPTPDASCIARKSRAMSGSPEVSRAVSQTMKLHDLTLRRVRLPLIRPYVLSYRTFTEFEPIIVEVRDGDGRVGWGEGHIGLKQRDARRRLDVLPRARLGNYWQDHGR